MRIRFCFTRVSACRLQGYFGKIAGLFSEKPLVGIVQLLLAKGVERLVFGVRRVSLVGPLPGGKGGFVIRHQPQGYGGTQPGAKGGGLGGAGFFQEGFPVYIGLNLVEDIKVGQAAADVNFPEGTGIALQDIDVVFGLQGNGLQHGPDHIRPGGAQAQVYKGALGGAVPVRSAPALEVGQGQAAVCTGRGGQNGAVDFSKGRSGSLSENSSRFAQLYMAAQASILLSST